MASRDKKGRFLKGHDLGGRPTLATELEYLAKLTSVVNPDRFAGIMEVVAALAESGELPACAMLMKYCLPDPAAAQAKREAKEQILRIAGAPNREAVTNGMVRFIMRRAEEMRAEAQAAEAPKKRGRKPKATSNPNVLTVEFEKPKPNGDSDGRGT